MRAFYGQRCGTAVDLAPAHPGYRHAACHVAGAPNPDALMHASSGASGAVEGGQGWHDAGDYGKYVVNSGITTGELIWTYEAYASRIGAVRLDIPESGNPVPDILDEIRWNLDWMLKMQDRDGGVWPKLTSERFGGFVMPELDNGGPRYVIGTGSAPYKSSCAPGGLRGGHGRGVPRLPPVRPGVRAPHARRCGAGVAMAVGASQRPFPELLRRPDGRVRRRHCADERLWAAAELFRTTGAAEYNSYFVASHAGSRPALLGGGAPAWPHVGTLALAAYYFSGQPSADEAVRAQIRADMVAAAEAIVARTAANPYRVSLRSTDYVWGSNGEAANYGVLLALAHQVQPSAAYLDAAADNLHYLLGRNTFGLSWVTQVGERPFRNPHHRPSGADTNAEPWPGLLSGGPNRYGGDPVIDAMPAAPPARRYRDDQGSYASNEIAVNWNAPLVFLVASLLPEGTP